jgi:hypothetical protein
VAPKRKFIVVCEGMNTEPNYFRALQQHFKNTLIAIEPIGGDPKAVVDRAVKCIETLGLIKGRRRGKMDSFELLDEVWAVFDRDEHPHFESAINRCLAKNIGIARSNPCFEVWLILHFEDFDKPDDRHEVQKYLQTICPEYDPNSGKTLDCERALGNLHEAETRALRQLDNRKKEGAEFGVPSTTVFQLINKLRTANERKAQSQER